MRLGCDEASGVYAARKICVWSDDYAGRGSRVVSKVDDQDLDVMEK